MASTWSWPEIWQGLSVAAAGDGVPERGAAGRPARRHRLPAADGPQGVGGGADAPRPQRGGAVRPAAVVRRPAEIRAQGAADPGRRRQGRVPAGAAGGLGAGAGGLGGDPAQREQLGPLGDLRPQRRRALPVRHLLARRLRHHHGRLGLQLEVPLPRLAALGRADGVLRGLDRLRHHHRAAVRRARSTSPTSSTRRSTGPAPTRARPTRCSTGTG